MSYQTIEGQQPANQYQPTNQYQPGNQEYRPTKTYRVSDEECEEYAEWLRREEQQERVWTRAEALIQKIGEAYDEVTRLVQQYPEVGRRVTEVFGEGGADRGEQNRQSARGREAYERIRRQSLALAEAAPRCRWVKQDGTGCRCPQMKNDVYCFAHRQMREAHTLMLRLPAQEDANAIQIGLMQVQKALVEDRISTKKAGLLLYSMQLALQNVGQVTFGQAKDEEMLTETVTEEEAVGEIGGSGDSERQNQHQHRGPFTAEDAEEGGRSERQHQHREPFTAKGAEDAEESGASGDREIGKAKANIHHGDTEARRKPGRGNPGADDRGWSRIAEPHANLG